MRITSKATIVSVAIYALIKIVVGAQAAAPRLLPFQARLTDANGAVVPDCTKVVQFKIYDSPTGGNAVWPGEKQKLTVNGGLVSTLLGSKSDLAGVDFNQLLYLEITVDAQAEGQPGNGTIDASDPPLLPRQSILPAVFAVEAGNSRKLEGYTLSQLPGALPVGSVIMWWGAKENVPVGWEVCDGRTPITAGETLGGRKPNLLDRFPKGPTDGVYDVKRKPDSTGGRNMDPKGSTELHILIESEIPSHTHSHTLTIQPNTGQHTHDIETGNTSRTQEGVGRFTGGSDDNEPSGMTVNSNGSGHSHPIIGSITAAGGGQGHNHPIPEHDNQPAFQEIFFIIRVK